jgi:hypothetical protein
MSLIESVCNELCFGWLPQFRLQLPRNQCTRGTAANEQPREKIFDLSNMAQASTVPGAKVILIVTIDLHKAIYFDLLAIRLVLYSPCSRESFRILPSPARARLLREEQGLSNPLHTIFPKESL